MSRSIERFDLLTLGNLLDALRRTPDNGGVTFDFAGFAPGRTFSYRGYYDDMAFEPVRVKITALSLRERLEGLIDTTMIGHKGGRYTITRRTRLWVDFPGAVSSTGIVEVHKRSGDLVLETTMVDG